MTADVELTRNQIDDLCEQLGKDPRNIAGITLHADRGTWTEIRWVYAPTHLDDVEPW
jgi:hypothetical protein